MAALRLNIAVGPDVKELIGRLSAFGELVPCPIEVIERVRSFPSAAAAVDLDFSRTVRAGEHGVVLKLSRRGLELLAAVRAVEVPRDLISELHKSAPSVGLAPPMVSESRAAEPSGAGDSHAILRGGRAE